MVDKTTLNLDDVSKRLEHYKNLKERFEGRLMERVGNLINSVSLDKMLEQLKELSNTSWDTFHTGFNTIGFSTESFRPLKVELYKIKDYTLRIGMDLRVGFNEEGGDDHLNYERTFEGQEVEQFYADILSKFGLAPKL